MSDLTAAGRRLRVARDRLAEATQIAERAAQAAQAGGVSEVEIARTLGVNRLTVRRWLGKN